MVFRLPRDCKYLLHLPESMLASWLSHTAPYPKNSPPMGFPFPSYSRLLITLLFWFFLLSLLSSSLNSLPMASFGPPSWSSLCLPLSLAPTFSFLSWSDAGSWPFSIYSFLSLLWTLPGVPCHTLSHVHNKNCADPYLGAVMLSIYTSYICICTITFNLYSFSIPCIHHKFLSKYLFNFSI